jgi:hypothetical protein
MTLQETIQAVKNINEEADEEITIDVVTNGTDFYIEVFGQIVWDSWDDDEIENEKELRKWVKESVLYEIEPIRKFFEEMKEE